ncbi:hypothetical protein POM88_031992 [Heracleum sosnowskyi]|uniref:Transposase (putative) gypsy type domain-containing protein n=1 Tax=Heracleum sosnowskyi TaxID=360622 RepID=A0AAD8MKC0_9APIA|nr:hypothetical protein POM88_031992 [Heracleum sosnowskyi]
MDVAIRASFQLGPEIECRWPEPHERVYDHTADGFSGVWLEHLRSGWTPRCLNFVKHLFKYVYKISIMQVTPNGVKWISWFLACCEQSNLMPTFKLFHQLFQLVRSNKKPLYELRFRAKECGYPVGFAQPVIQQSTLKGWGGEVIMLRGWDLEGMPHMVEGGESKNFETFDLTGVALAKIKKFCGSLGFPCTRDTFMDYKKLFELGCLPHYNPDLESMMASSSYVLSLRKLVGVHNDKAKKIGDESGSSAAKEGGAESATPNVVRTEAEFETIDFDDVEVPGSRPEKKRKVHCGRKPPSKPKMVIDKVVVDGDWKGPDRRSVMFGSFTLKKLAEMAFEIPTDEEMGEM